MDKLPDGYQEIKRINLQEDKKVILILNGIALSIFIVMVVIANHFKPVISTLGFNNYDSIIPKLIVTLILLIAYVFLHELVHGVFMKLYSNIKPHYGFTGLYAYAGSKAYYNKKQYIIIALSPIVIIGVILLVFNILLPNSWFWVIYIIQVVNISGAAGDLYVSNIIRKAPIDTLTQDEGVSMTMYSRN